MAEAKRFAVVTGANRGTGFYVVRQLASQGITVVLTARDENNSLRRLKESAGFSDEILFHQLDVSDSSSVASLAEFIKAQFGRLDILVKNAGIGGAIVDEGTGGAEIDWNKILTQTYEGAVNCLQTNYYGSKRMVEAFLPLLQLSPSPRIVNVSSNVGGIKREWKEGSLAAKGWPLILGEYIVSKAGLNAYTRIVAKNQSSMKVNCLCPGFVKTDLNFNKGVLTVDEGVQSVMRLALLPDDGPSGLFFIRAEETPC